jgi:hypothetical protein
LSAKHQLEVNAYLQLKISVAVCLYLLDVYLLHLLTHEMRNEAKGKRLKVLSEGEFGQLWGEWWNFRSSKLDHK